MKHHHYVTTKAMEGNNNTNNHKTRSSNMTVADRIERQHVAALVRMSPGRTSKELAGIHAEPTGLDRHEIARRLTECEARKMVISEGRGSGKEITWFPSKLGG